MDSSLPPELLVAVVNNLADARDAASFACAGREGRDAYRASRAFHRVRVARDGEVHEPASGAFDVTVAPGESVAEAIARCPTGGCVLLLPGTHSTIDNVNVDHDVHVFGRRQTTVNARVHVHSDATFTGITFAQVAIVIGARARFRGCVFHNFVAWCAGADPTFDRCDFHGHVFVGGEDTRGRFTRNGVHHVGLNVESGASPVVSLNTFWGAGHADYNTSIFVALLPSREITIADNIIADAYVGIVVAALGPSACRIERNAISRCVRGVQLEGEVVAHIADNDMVGNNTAISMMDWTCATIAGNRIHGDGDGDGIDLKDRSESTCENNEFDNNGVHVAVNDTSHATVTDNRFRNGVVGIFFSQDATCTHRRNSLRNVWVPSVRQWHIQATLGAVGLSLLLAFRPRSLREAPGSLAALVVGAGIAHRLCR